MIQLSSMLNSVCMESFSETHTKRDIHLDLCVRFCRPWAFGKFPMCSNCKNVAMNVLACVSSYVSIAQVFRKHVPGGTISRAEGVCSSSAAG